MKIKTYFNMYYVTMTMHLCWNLCEKTTDPTQKTMQIQYISPTLIFFGFFYGDQQNPSCEYKPKKNLLPEMSGSNAISTGLITDIYFFGETHG